MTTNGSPPFSVTRRSAVFSLACMFLTPRLAAAAKAEQPFVLPPEFLPQLVDYTSPEAIGTIVIEPAKRFLYFVEAYGVARRYGVGVGRAGATFRGSATIERKAKWPAWRPTANMIKRNPEKYAKYAQGMPGGPGNPLGSRALYLYRDGVDTFYRIHGTTEPWSIGKAVSNGCIRMLNEHLEELYDRVPLGTKVVVIA